MLLPLTLIDRGDFRIMARQAGKFDEGEELSIAGILLPLGPALRYLPYFRLHATARSRPLFDFLLACVGGR